MTAVRYLLAASFCVLFLSGLLYAVAGQGAVARAYAGTPANALEARIPVRADMPLVYNQERADAVAWSVYRVGVMCWLLASMAGFVKNCAFPLRTWLVSHWTQCMGAVLFFLAPHMMLKVLGLFLVAYKCVPPKRQVVLSRDVLSLLWAGVFSLAFLAAPYWTLPGPAWVWPETLLLIGVAALVWGRSVAGQVSLEVLSRIDVVSVGVCAIILYVLHRAALSVGVPLLGDEDYHIKEVLFLCEAVAPAWLCLVPVIGLACWGVLGSRHLTWTRASFWVLASGALTGMGYLRLQDSIVRYPYFSRWFEAMPVVPVSLAGLSLYSEALFRIVPFLSIVALCALCWGAIGSSGKLWRVPAVLAFATIPVVTHFASMLYLELPAVLLMVHVCMRAQKLIRADVVSIRQEPAWISLLLLGFIKETTLPFIAAFLGVRFLFRLYPRLSWTRVVDEIKVAVMCCLPLLVFLVCRSFGDVFRGYALRPENFANAALYKTLFASWGTQFGPVLILAAVGVVLAVRGRRFENLALWGAVMAVTTLFFVGEREEFLGYSRFNLYFLPPVIAAALSVCCTVTRRPILINGGVVAILAVNLAWSPVLADGARAPGWGEPALHISERSYPMREALAWVHNKDPESTLLITGFEYPYFTAFYENKWEWFPRVEQLTHVPGKEDVEEYMQRHDLQIVLMPSHLQSPVLMDGDHLRPLCVISNSCLGVSIMGLTASGGGAL